MREREECLVGLIGRGLLYQNVRRHIESMYRFALFTAESSPQQLAACKIVVYCSDIWLPGVLREINRRCLQANVALLPVFTRFDEGIIGPCVIPQKQGCTSCAELRSVGTASSEVDREFLHRFCSKEHGPAVSQPWLSSFSLEVLTVLVGEEITGYTREPDHLQTINALLSVSLTTLECRKHIFLPCPSCPDCGKLSEDEADLATITLQSRPKADRFTYRIRQPVATPERILSTYVDQQTGLVSSLAAENTHLLPIASSHLSFEGEAIAGTGCTLRPEQSRVVSILEIVERYAGLRPRSKRSTVRASYRQLLQKTEQVLDPTTLGLHSSEQYEQHKRNYSPRQLVPYHHDLVCHWVWGYSFQRQAPILVPEHCAYYGIPASAENPVFVSEISNGCALGNCLEEAIFHGILEVVERDAFLLTWYAQLQVPHLDLYSVTDPTIRLLTRHLEYHSGYTIYACNVTLDHAVPCLCLLGVDEQNRGDRPKALVAAGSHPHPEQALLKALREFAVYLAFPRRLDQQSRAQALEMLADSSRVREIDHHPLLYSLPEAFERLHFLYQSTHQQTFQEAFQDFYRYPPECVDLRDDLNHLIDFYVKHGLDIIVVDQTAPEHLPCGLRCVKVLIPGMLPMTFGQNNRRVRGFGRLHQLPFTLGYRSHPLAEAEINPYPHPFF
ncbi:MAG TPA: TOMM precursor leader peptide-binding protein [Ktedonobacteraceae bacterium]|nr:TOMM precursor leader peptide-binding protein [Ktedonobacteraceae bacterium]